MDQYNTIIIMSGEKKKNFTLTDRKWTLSQSDEENKMLLVLETKSNQLIFSENICWLFLFENKNIK